MPALLTKHVDPCSPRRHRLDQPVHLPFLRHVRLRGHGARPPAGLDLGDHGLSGVRKGIGYLTTTSAPRPPGPRRMHGRCHGSPR